MMGSTQIILEGIPGAGKSTFLRKFLSYINDDRVYLNWNKQKINNPESVRNIKDFLKKAYDPKIKHYHHGEVSSVWAYMFKQEYKWRNTHPEPTCMIAERNSATSLGLFFRTSWLNLKEGIYAGPYESWEDTSVIVSHMKGVLRELNKNIKTVILWFDVAPNIAMERVARRGDTYDNMGLDEKTLTLLARAQRAYCTGDGSMKGIPPITDFYPEGSVRVIRVENPSNNDLEETVRNVYEKVKDYLPK